MGKIRLHEVEPGIFEFSEVQRMFKNYNEVLKNYGKENVMDFSESWKALEDNLTSYNDFKLFLFKNEHGESVGFVILQDIKQNEYGNDISILYISDFYIAPTYRRKGIGTLAINELINKYGTRLWFWYVIKENKPAIAFWNRISSTLLTPVIDSSCKVINEDELKSWANKYVAAPSDIWDECFDALINNKKSVISKGEALNLLRNYLNFIHVADNSKLTEELVKQTWEKNCEE